MHVQLKPCRRDLCLPEIKSGHIRDATRRGPGGKEVPPPTLVGNVVPGEPSPLRSYASAAPQSTLINKSERSLNGKGLRVGLTDPPLERTSVAASGGSAITVPPTKLSFKDIISGVGRNLFNLH